MLKLNFKLIRLIIIACAVVGAIVLGTIVLKLALAILLSPLFWMIVIVGGVAHLIFNAGKKTARR
jgi:hypothetical protein